MKRSDFNYQLPPHLIAQAPLPDRTGSRLLVLDGETGEINDSQFSNILDHVDAGDILVFNDTRVIPARLFGAKETGGKVEVLVERVVSNHEVLAHVRSSKSPKPGTHLLIDGDVCIEVMGRQGELFELRFDDERTVFEILDAVGHIPLPPYIERADAEEDFERYQTVYAKNPGAVAAPTAGLHFDQALLDALKKKGVATAYVTLHVGAGTFQPVRVDDIDDHYMHSEYVEVTEEACQQIRAARERGGRVIAVGTTAVRSLESASQRGELLPFSSETQIFITPGYQFKTVDCLITNFHLPESTLLMLVSALAGHAHIMAAYEHAVAQSYRFFSYGDAMMLLPQATALVSRQQE